MLALPAKVLADALAPFFARWSESREQHILKLGQPLPPSLLTFADRLGIRDPQNLRVEIRAKVPLPLPDRFITLARKLRIPVFHPAGMCLGRGITSLALDAPLLRHELVHTLQYQRFESHKAFMWHYVFQCLRHGYLQAPLEIEARERSGD